MADEKYFFDQDDDGHWFMIPIARRDEWRSWQGVDLDKGDNYDKWCKSGFEDYSIGGSINDIEFIPINK